MRSRAPRRVHPRRVGSTYLLSGLVRCKQCRRALSGQDSKSGKFSYYVCQSCLRVPLFGSGIALVFSHEPWQADTQLDELARLLLHPELKGEKPGRNQPCWCGSGQKYKRCHS